MVRVVQQQEVLHYPRLDTVLMVEDEIKKAGDYPSKMELWRRLPRKTQYQTFKVILDYLVASHKAFITREGKIMWVFTEAPAAKKLLKSARGRGRRQPR